MRDSIADVWVERTPHLHNMWPVREDGRTLEEPERWVQSACVLCSNGCGLDIGATREIAAATINTLPRRSA